jgi:hypothetical protein
MEKITVVRITAILNIARLLILGFPLTGNEFLSSRNDQQIPKAFGRAA